MKTTFFRFLTCSSMLLATTVTTFAVPITFNISGTISSITYSERGQTEDDFNYAVGDAFSVVISFDSTLIDSNPDPSAGIYGGRDPGSITMDTSLGGRIYNGGFDILHSRVIWTGDGSGIPGQTAEGIKDAFRIGVEGPVSHLANVILTDTTGGALSSDALPLALDLSDWDGGEFTFFQPWHTIIRGEISGIRTVPETVGLPTLVLTICGVLLLHRRVKASSASASRGR